MNKVKKISLVFLGILFLFCVIGLPILFSRYDVVSNGYSQYDIESDNAVPLNVELE